MYETTYRAGWKTSPIWELGLHFSNKSQAKETIGECFHGHIIRMNMYVTFPNSNILAFVCINVNFVISKQVQMSFCIYTRFCFRYASLHVKNRGVYPVVYGHGSDWAFHNGSDQCLTSDAALWKTAILLLQWSDQCINIFLSFMLLLPPSLIHTSATWSLGWNLSYSYQFFFYFLRIPTHSVHAPTCKLMTLIELTKEKGIILWVKLVHKDNSQIKYYLVASFM